MMILKGGSVHPMHMDPFVGDVAFHNGKIVEIGANINIPGAEIVDVSGKFVLPGLVDAHSHIGISEEKVSVLGDSCNEGTNPVTPTMRAIDAINPMDSAFHNALAVGNAVKF